VSRRAFFFPHSLDPAQKPGTDNISGRVPFEVTGTLLGSEGRGSEGRPFWVMADGFMDPLGDAQMPGVVGSYQDPCVFCDPWGPFHAFLRLDGTNLANEKVMGGGKVIADSLPEVVSPGDLIIYGKTNPNGGKNIKEIWVDTVMVVDSIATLPVIASPETPDKPPYTFALASDPSLPGKGTPAHRYSLSDAETKGVHETTNRNPHRIIVGRVSKEPDAVEKLETSFVPLADRTGGVCRALAVDKGHMGAAWGPLLEFFEQGVFAKVKGIPRGGWIAELPSFALAEALLTAVVKRSGGHQGMRGTVAVPPLSPVGGTKRWNPRTARVFPG
jgi:hypothetical protein